MPIINSRTATAGRAAKKKKTFLIFPAAWQWMGNSKTKHDKQKKNIRYLSEQKLRQEGNLKNDSTKEKKKEGKGEEKKDEIKRKRQDL